MNLIRSVNPDLKDLWDEIPLLKDCLKSIFSLNEIEAHRLIQISGIRPEMTY